MSTARARRLATGIAGGPVPDLSGVGSGFVGTRRRERSRKPDGQNAIIEGCSPAPRIELFARGVRPAWTAWRMQAADDDAPTCPTCGHNSATECGAMPVPPLLVE